MSLYQFCSHSPVYFPFLSWISSKHFNLFKNFVFMGAVVLFLTGKTITISGICWAVNNYVLLIKRLSTFWEAMETFHQWECVSILIKCKIILITSNNSSRRGLRFIQINEQTVQIPRATEWNGIKLHVMVSPPKIIIPGQCITGASVFQFIS